MKRSNIKRSWSLARAIYREGEGSATPTATPNPTPPNPTPTATVTMTQAEFDRKMAEHKRTVQQKNQELQEQLRQQIESGKLTKEEIEQKEARIQELQSEFQTKEEQAKTEYQKLQTKYDNDLKKANETAKSWEGRFDEMLITNSILSAATRKETEAFNPDQVVELLRNKARRTEILDNEGKPTGKFGVKIKFTAVRDGKNVELDLTPEETLKAMTEMPQTYGNLFKSGVTGGLGGNNSNGNNGNTRLTSLANMSMEEYAKRREEVMNAVDKGN